MHLGNRNFNQNTCNKDFKWNVYILCCNKKGNKERFPGSALDFMLNVCLIKSSYVGAFWFVQTYTILALLSGYIFKIVKKYTYWIVLPISLIGYIMAFGIEYTVLEKIEMEAVKLFVNALIFFMRSQFSFVIGMYFVKENVLDRSKVLCKIKNNQILPWVFFIVIIVARAIFTHMIFAPFSAAGLVVLFGIYNW